MSKAIRIHEHGGPDVLCWDEVDPGTPGAGQALIRQTAVGLNFIDVYHRTGLYPVPSRPAINIAVNAKYGFAVASGKRTSTRRPLGLDT